MPPSILGSCCPGGWLCGFGDPATEDPSSRWPPMAQGELCGEAAVRGKLSGQDKGSVQEAQEKPLPPTKRRCWADVGHTY